MINKLDATFRFYEDAANLRAHRQQLIASNIANVDTPNFKARDINFKDALENAGGNKIVKLATNAPNHIASPGSRRRSRSRCAVDVPGGHTGKRGRQYGRYGYRAQPVCRQRHSL